MLVISPGVGLETGENVVVVSVPDPSSEVVVTIDVVVVSVSPEVEGAGVADPLPGKDCCKSKQCNHH